jgi:hypothetical protein
VDGPGHGGIGFDRGLYRRSETHYYEVTTHDWRTERVGAKGSSRGWLRFRQKSRPSRLKWRNSPYRPAAQQGNLPAALVPVIPDRLLGRSQAVRQRILIPPFGGSIPPAPASVNTLNFLSKR